MRCKNCGDEIDEDSNRSYCGHCERQAKIEDDDRQPQEEEE